MTKTGTPGLSRLTSTSSAAASGASASGPMMTSDTRASRKTVVPADTVATRSVQMSCRSSHSRRSSSVSADVGAKTSTGSGIRRTRPLPNAATATPVTMQMHDVLHVACQHSCWKLVSEGAPPAWLQSTSTHGDPVLLRLAVERPQSDAEGLCDLGLGLRLLQMRTNDDAFDFRQRGLGGYQDGITGYGGDCWQASLDGIPPRWSAATAQWIRTLRARWFRPSQASRRFRPRS